VNHTRALKAFFVVAVLTVGLIISIRANLAGQQPTGSGNGNPPSGPGSGQQGGPRAVAPPERVGTPNEYKYEREVEHPSRPQYAPARRNDLEPWRLESPQASRAASAMLSGAIGAASKPIAPGPKLVLDRIWSADPSNDEFTAAHLAEYYVGIGPSGEILTKDAFLRSRTERSSFHLDALRTTHAYENTSLLIGILKGPAESYRYTAVLINVDGSWMLVTSQLTRISQ